MLCAANPEGISLVFWVYFRTVQTKPVAASGKFEFISRHSYLLETGFGAFSFFGP